MSTKHNPPRQDRRNIGRAVVKKHDEHSVGTSRSPAGDAGRPTILDPLNGSPWGADGSGNAPGSSGPTTN